MTWFVKSRRFSRNEKNIFTDDFDLYKVKIEYFTWAWPLKLWLVFSTEKYELKRLSEILAKKKR